MDIFHPITCTLTGNHILDASAGTGKTYSLSFLYLRMVLELQLGVRDILVTTFTRAAVAELKGRIYAILSEAEKRLRQQMANNSANDIDDNKINETDNTLADYLCTFADQADIACYRLQLARAEFEQAQIFTIDGYFFQLVQQHTLSLGTYIPEQLLSNNQALVKTIFFDLARNRFAELARPDLTAQVLVDFNPVYFNDEDKDSTEDKFVRILSQIIEYDDYFHQCRDYSAQFADLERQRTALAQTATELHRLLPQKLNLLTQLLAEKKLNRRSYSQLDALREALISPTAWLEAEDDIFTPLTNVAAAKGFNQSLDDDTLQSDSFYTDVVTFLQQRKYCYHDLPTHLVYGELAHVISQHLVEEKARQLAHTYLDMTQLVAQHASSGKLTATHTVAMIDEAQDTNAAQVAVFRALFFEPADKHAFFVGDVKQAIYKFRGANVHAYQAAKAELTQQHRLETNYRSNRALNDSINWLFGDLPDFAYTSVQSHRGNTDIDHAEVALTVVNAADNSETAHVNATVALILRYLDGTNFINGKPVQYKDMAVLVHNKTQGKAIRSALLEHGISAAYSAKQQVFHSDEAMWLYTLLNAWLTPKTSLVRALLVSPLFLAKEADLYDDSKRDALRLSCQHARKNVEQRGIIVALAQFMHESDCATTLLRQVDGRRRLTNFLHLAELLDKKGQSLFALIDTLNRHMNADDPESELRVDDDKALTIETIHGSKGLEYPLVILPFFTRGSAPNTKGLMISHKLKRAGFAFSHVDGLEDAFIDEEADEHYRQLYVALTRAKYRNIMIIGKRKAADKSDSTFDHSDWAKLRLPERKVALVKQAFCEEITPDYTPLTPEKVSEEVTLPTLHQLDRDLSPEWLLESFSKLNHRYVHLDSKQALDKNPETLSEKFPVDKAVLNETPPENALLAFPRGINPGHVMHEWFEHIMTTRELSDATSTLRHLCNQYSLDVNEIPAHADALTKVVQHPFLAKNRCLLDIDSAQQSIEMAFYLHLSAKARTRLLQQFGDNLNDSTINGFINGHIDLMFCLDKKYYLLDYKSNHLGNSVCNYHQQAMRAEMHAHRYDLQALIYTIALTQHLRLTLSNFDYDTHIGGYYYLFVRGIQSGEDTGIYQARFSEAEITPYLT